MTGLDAWAAAQPDRCEHGFSPLQRGIHDCTPIAPTSEWSLFVAALRSAARSDGLIHQTDVRPLIQAIPHKHRGTYYRKAKSAGLIELVGKEPSTDAAGRNTDKDQKVYRLRSAA
jgi:hypothetical protein